MFDMNSFFMIIFILAGLAIACFAGVKIGNKIVSFLEKKEINKKITKIEE